MIRTPETIREQLAAQPAHIIDPTGRSQAAVTLLLLQESDGLNVLLIERATHEQDPWSGHIALPGGRVEPFDENTKEAAERETLEEIGLHLNDTHYLGQLDDLVPGRFPMVISCFVYALPQRPELIPEPAEVADAFWFPLLEMDCPDRATSIQYGDETFPAVKVHHAKDQPLWGITYRLLENFRSIVGC